MVGKTHNSQNRDERQDKLMATTCGQLESRPSVAERSAAESINALRTVQGDFDKCPHIRYERRSSFDANDSFVASTGPIACEAEKPLARCEIFADPENLPHPEELLKPPIFRGRFTSRSSFSDAYMRGRWHFTKTANCARRRRSAEPDHASQPLPPNPSPAGYRQAWQTGDPQRWPNTNRQPRRNGKLLRAP